ncbi:MAG: hypothetical protein JSU58_09620 [Dehalococcoidales bacterium]|nr:MAG: hypothetical protein JSU58_09620 [Dehalococcoidales bacterium]
MAKRNTCLVIILSTFWLLLLPGCGITQSEYESLSKEYTLFCDELDKLNAELPLLRGEINRKENQLSELDDKLTQIRSEITQSRITLDSKARSIENILGNTKSIETDILAIRSQIPGLQDDLNLITIVIEGTNNEN